MTLDRQCIAVVLPLANEESTVKELVDRIFVHLLPDDHLFCVVDNISVDRTKEILQSYEDDRLVMVWAPENTCISDAYFAGYRAALESDAEWILEMDGGLSHQPEQIPSFMKAMGTGVDFAAGSRFLTDSLINIPYKRYILSKGGTILANLVLGTKMHDMTSGFECFTKNALNHVVLSGVKSKAHFFQTEIRYHLREWNWVEVPITYTNDNSAVGSSSVFEALHNLWELRKSER